MPSVPLNPVSSSTIPRFLLFLLPIVALSALEQRNNTRIPECYSFQCGDGVPIGYPFWNATADASYCGYQHLGVVCKEGHPIFNLGRDSYKVARVNYDTRIITLQDVDLLGSNCPRARHNLTLQNSVPLIRTPEDSFLRFFFDCSVNWTDGDYHGNYLPCLRSQSRGGDNFSYVFGESMDLPTLFTTFFPNCENHVVAPVLRTAIPSNLSSQFFSALRSGFELSWQTPNMSDCISCEETGGNCGYVLSKYAEGYDFQCFCSDGRHSSNCKATGGMSKSKMAMIGAGAAGGFGFLLASLCCFLVYRRKTAKARTGSSTLLFRAPSSETPSKDAEMGSSHYSTHLFRYEELQEATNGFSPDNELGDGGFGTVYKGKLRDGRIVAVKRLYESNYRRVEQFQNEVAILNRIRQPNLVMLYGCTSRHSRELLLVYEFVPNGTVADHLHGPRATEGALTWPVRLNVAVQTATALAYLHAVEIVHRDVKTNNILLDSNFHVKVADFGLSRLFPVDVTHVSTAPQGTPGYVDPEYYQCYQLTDRSDVYSFGVVLAELISSKPAVDITRHRHEINLANMAINKIQNDSLHELVDPALEFETDWEANRTIRLVAELAFQCLQAEREARPSMEDVVKVLQRIHDSGDADGSKDMDRSPADDACLLKTSIPFSPDSVMNRWASRTTTPNISA